MRNSIEGYNLLKDVINQSKSPNFDKQLVYTEEFINLKNSLENFINWSYDVVDFDKTGLLLIIVNHPFWENIMLEWNIYQKEYLDYFLILAFDIAKFIEKKWYYITKGIKNLQEWVDFVHKPNLSNLSIITRLVYKLISEKTKKSVEEILKDE